MHTTNDIEAMTEILNKRESIHFLIVVLHEDASKMTVWKSECFPLEKKKKHYKWRLSRSSSFSLEDYLPLK